MTENQSTLSDPNRFRYQGHNPATGDHFAKSGSLEDLTILADQMFRRQGLEPKMFRPDGTQIEGFMTESQAEFYLSPRIKRQSPVVKSKL